MRSVYLFLRSTVIGGLVVLAPVVIFGALLVWVVETVQKVLAPLLRWLPEKSVAGVSLGLLIVVLGLVMVCFVAGIFAQMAVIRRVSERAERYALFLPGYALLKNVGANMIGIEGKHPAQTVLVGSEGSWQLGFQMDTLRDGRHIVFIPGVPRALVGALHIIAADRVRPLPLSVTAALDALSRLGAGLRENLIPVLCGATSYCAVRMIHAKDPHIEVSNNVRTD
jgi:uncharacterized membrane protein